MKKSHLNIGGRMIHVVEPIEVPRINQLKKSISQEEFHDQMNVRQQFREESRSYEPIVMDSKIL